MQRTPSKTLCRSGNTVERWYDRQYRSFVTRVIDREGNQIGDADYVGNKISADSAYDFMVKREGGKEGPIHHTWGRDGFCRYCHNIHRGDFQLGSCKGPAPGPAYDQPLL